MQNYLNTSKSNFSDKYFDYEYYLPVVNQSNMLNYMNRVLSALQDDNYNIGELTKAWASYGTDICFQLGNIRNLKRYLNLFLTRYFLISDEIDVHDYLYLTLLRFKDLNAYNALTDGTLIHRGRDRQTTDNLVENIELYYLNSDIDDVINQQHYWEFTKKILQELFPITVNTPTELKDYYNRIQYTMKFYQYMYDYQSLLLNQKELKCMISAESDKEATERLDTLAKSYQMDIRAFLIKELQGFPKTNTSFSRLLVLVFEYMSKFSDDLGFVFEVTDLFESPIKRNLIRNKQFRTIDDYRAFWDSNIDKFGNDYPYELSHVFQLVYNNQNPTEPHPLFKTAELHNELLKLQKIYLKKAKLEGNFYKAFLMSQIYSMSSDNTQTPKEFGKYDNEAADILFNSMKASPEEFIKVIINMQTGGGQLQVWLDNALIDITAQYPVKFLGFLLNLKNKIAKDIIVWLDEEENKQRIVEYTNRQNPSLQDLHELLKVSYRDEDSKLVLKALEDEHCYDIAHIKQWIRSGKNKSLHNDIRKIFQYLHDKNDAGNAILNYKDKIEPFKPNDLVKIDKDESQILKIERNTIRRVVTVTGDTYHVEGLAEPIPVECILPIYIDGICDKDIYYDSVADGSVIGGNDTKPVHHIVRQYYMDQFKNDRIISALISNNNCQYVHEVQHVLHDNGFDGQLRVKSSRV